MLDDADPQSAPTKSHLLVAKLLESHMREWDNNWGFVVADAKTNKKEFFCFDVRVMIRWDIIATCFKSAFWANHCPRGRHSCVCKECGGASICELVENGAIARSVEVLASASMDDRGANARSAEVLASASMDEEGADARSAEVLASQAVSMDE